MPDQSKHGKDELYRSPHDKREGGEGREVMKSKRGRGQRTGPDDREMLDPEKKR
jgi:hypothetical protein